MEEAMEIYKDMKLIDKDKIVAEIKKLTNHFKTCQTLNSYEDGLKEGRLIGYEDALYKINTLEVEEDAVHGTVDYPLIGCDFPNIYPNYKELKEYCDRKGIKDNDKVKLIIIKDM